MPFAETRMELETLILSEASQKEKDKYHITYIWNRIYSTNKPFHRKETHGLGEQPCGCQKGGGGNEMDWESEVDKCKLSCRYAPGRGLRRLGWQPLH